MQVKIVLDFDDKKLGEDWLTQSKIEKLFYTDYSVTKNLLRLICYEETPEDTTNYSLGYLSGLPSSITEVKGIDKKETYNINKEKYERALNLLARAKNPKVEFCDDFNKMKSEAIEIRFKYLTEAYSIFSELIKRELERSEKENKQNKKFCQVQVI